MNVDQLTRELARFDPHMEVLFGSEPIEYVWLCNHGEQKKTVCQLLPNPPKMPMAWTNWTPHGPWTPKKVKKGT